MAKRSLVFGIPCLALLTLLIALPLGARNEIPDATSPGLVGQFLRTTKPVAIEEGDDPLRKLLKQRFNVAVAEFQERYSGHQSGESTPRQMFDAALRLIEAELALVRTPAERVEVLERHLPALLEFETTFQTLVNSGLRTSANLNRLRFERLTIEIELQRARTDR